MAKAKKKANTYPVYYAGGTVKQMGMDEIKKMMMGGGVKLSKRTFAYGGKTQKFAQGGKPDYIDIDGDGNKNESMKSAAKEAKTPKANKGMFLKKKSKK
jgi:hypothetical protein